MKFKIFLSSFLALLIFSSVGFAATTKDYKLTAPAGSTNMNYTQNAYNDLGNLVIEVDSTDTTVTFAASTIVKVKVSYDENFTLTNGTDSVAYKLVTGPSSNTTDLPNDNTITFDVSSKNSESVKIGAVITGDSSNISDGDYRSSIKFIGLPVVGQKNYEFGNFTVNNETVSLDWRVLSVDEANNRALLVTEKAVTQMAYSSNNSNAWSTSDVKQFLNNETYNNNDAFLKNFTDEEKARILKVSITDGNDGQNKNSSEIIASNQNADNLDYFFLLSKADVQNGSYFGVDSSNRVCYLLTNPNQICSWRLRSPGRGDDCVACVDAGGGVYDSGHYVVLDFIAVRPAVWLDLNR